jgi:hypothetical protein
MQTGLSIASFGMGVLFFFTGCIYALRLVHIVGFFSTKLDLKILANHNGPLFIFRSVNQLVLIRNGARIIVRTYTPFGTAKQFSVPLTDVSCLGSRLGMYHASAFRIADY